MTDIWPWALLGYLLGSVPFGLLVTRALGLADPRGIGSGNIGATNVLRTGSKTAALATLLLDGGKGALAVLLARHGGGEAGALAAGGAAFVGHCYPVWLRLRGGKGVATFLGLLLALEWPLGLAACGVWIATAALARLSSLAALTAALWSPVLALLLGRADAAPVVAGLAILLAWRHRANIARIRDGTEPRIGRRPFPPGPRRPISAGESDGDEHGRGA